MLVVNFGIPDANHMAEMSRLVALVSYYIDLIECYKLSSKARSKTEAGDVRLHKKYTRSFWMQGKKCCRKRGGEEEDGGGG